MNTRYKIVFSIELLCEYYKDLKCNDFEVVPDSRTSKILKDHKMIYRMVGNMLFVLAKVDENDKIFHSLNPEIKFNFYLKLIKPSFSNFANINLNELSFKKLYFTNLSGNEANSSLFLSLPIKSYSNAESYLPGDFAANGSNVFENIKASTGSNTSNDEFWVLKGEDQYVNSEDLLELRPMLSSYEVSASATVFKISVFGFNVSTGNYDKAIPLEKSTISIGSDPQNLIQLDLRFLPPGKYRILINGEEFMTYLDSFALYNNTFGIIEIFSHLDHTDPFSFYDDQGKVKDKKVGDASEWLRYSILFSNRRAFWKYISTRNSVVSISDSTSTYSFERSPAAPDPVEYFQSEKPIPLSENPKLLDIEIPLSSGGGPVAAPNPDPRNAGMLNQIDDNFYCTIFLNY